MNAVSDPQSLHGLVVEIVTRPSICNALETVGQQNVVSMEDDALIVAY